MRRFERFFTLPAGDRRLLVEAGLTVTGVRLKLWLLPLKRVIERVEKAVPHSRHSPTDAARLAWAVAVASRFVPHASCLTQALAAKLLLARCGLASEVRFGVARNAAGVFEAHAWLEHEGRIILGNRADLSSYAALPPVELPAKGHFPSQVR